MYLYDSVTRLQSILSFFDVKFIVAYVEEGDSKVHLFVN